MAPPPTVCNKSRIGHEHAPGSFLLCARQSKVLFYLGQLTPATPRAFLSTVVVPNERTNHRHHQFSSRDVCNCLSSILLPFAIVPCPFRQYNGTTILISSLMIRRKTNKETIIRRNTVFLNGAGANRTKQTTAWVTLHGNYFLSSR